MGNERKKHWEDVYQRKPASEVSWYQEFPEMSLALITRSGISKQDAVIDIGGGASTLVDHLLDGGYSDVTVLDFAGSAFEQSRERLGKRAAAVNWVISDVTLFEPQRQYKVWHDRAVLHFLTDPKDRERYVAVLQEALAVGGQAVIATFGPDGPLKCSGLEIRRYTIEVLEELLGPGFELQDHEIADHHTPMNSTQQFLYSRWIRRG